MARNIILQLSFHGALYIPSRLPRVRALDFPRVGVVVEHFFLQELQLEQMLARAVSLSLPKLKPLAPLSSTAYFPREDGNNETIYLANSIS